MRRRGISFFLSIVLLVLGTEGCGQSYYVNTQRASEQTSAESGKTDVNTASKPVTLTWYLEGSNVKDDSQVLEKANEYLKEKLNVTVKPIWGTWGDFDRNVILAIKGSENVDIYFTSSWTADQYVQYAKNGAFIRLDSKKDNMIGKYCPTLWKQLPEVLTRGALVDGSEGYGIYAIPGYKDYANQYCWDVNVPLLEKYGYTAEDIRNADYYTFGDMLAKVKSGEGSRFYPLMCESDIAESITDRFAAISGDGTAGCLAYSLNTEDPSEMGQYGDKIVDRYETEEFRKFCEQSRSYYLAGYIAPQMGMVDKASDYREASQKTGSYLISTQSYSYGYEKQASAERGFEVAMIPATPLYADTVSSQGAMMAVSSESKNPEKAVMFLNLLNTDPYLMTLMDYGVEGVHYVKDNDGAVHFTDMHDEYSPWINGMGNITLLPRQDGQGTDYTEKWKAYYGSAKANPAIGFYFDVTPVNTISSSINNVSEQYIFALESGTVDPAEKLPEFIQKLKDNGIDNLVAEANKQLRAFRKSQNSGK